MNMVFSDIGLTTDVTLISVGNMSASTKDIYTLFDSLAQAGGRGYDLPAGKLGIGYLPVLHR